MAQTDISFDGDNYSTVVVCHPDAKGAQTFSREMLERFPMFADDGAARITMIGNGDVPSTLDAVVMALETNALDYPERIQLALDVSQLFTWPACIAKFAEWEVEVKDGQLVDAQVSS